MITIKGLRAGTNALIMILIVFGILVMVNILVTRFFVRVDLTEGKIYTISSSTRDVLKRLDDIINIEVYFSEKDLPAYLMNLRQQIKDILNEYKIYGHGNLQLKFIDPKADPKVEEKMQAMGIPQVQAQSFEKDKTEVVNIYLGIAVLYKDKKEVLPVVRNVSSLEYDLTASILKVSSPKAKTIGFLTGHDEHDIYEDRDYSQVRQVLQQQKYTVITVDTSEGKKVSDDVDTLIVAGPKKQLSERDKYEIDQFLMRGGRAVFLVDSVNMPPGMLYAMPLSTGLNDMLEHYGVKLGNNLVMDESRAQASFGRSTGGMTISYSVPYYYWPKIIKKKFAPHSITSQLENLVLPWTSALEIIAPEGGEVKVTELVKSTEHSWTAQSPYNLDPQQRFYQTPSDRKSHPLAVELSGKFKSFYAGKEIPKVESSDEESASSPPPDDSVRETIEASPETQIIVIGNSNFASNGILMQLPRGQSNMIFFQNIVDWLTLGDELINIRSREVTDRPLKENLSEATKGLVQFICVLGVPIIIFIFGIVRFFLRKRAKKLFEAYRV